jgi:hypothetical protein
MNTYEVFIKSNRTLIGAVQAVNVPIALKLASEKYSQDIDTIEVELFKWRWTDARDLAYN